MSNSGCSSGALNAWNNNLKRDAYDAFSQNLADVSKHFRKNWGIKFQIISPMNEPYNYYWSAYSDKQEGCHFDQGDSQSKIIIALKKVLGKKGFSDIEISAADETSIDSKFYSYHKLKWWS